MIKTISRDVLIAGHDERVFGYLLSSLRATRDQDAGLHNDNRRQHRGNQFPLRSANHKPRVAGLWRASSVSCCV